MVDRWHREDLAGVGAPQKLDAFSPDPRGMRPQTGFDDKEKAKAPEPATPSRPAGAAAVSAVSPKTTAEPEEEQGPRPTPSMEGSSSQTLTEAALAALPSEKRRVPSKSPRAFRSLAKSIFGMGRFLSIADEGLDRNVDVQGIVSRIALTIATPETFKKVSLNVFEKFAMDVQQPDGSVEQQIPTARLPNVLEHWQIPEDHIGIFWAMIRKMASHWDARVLPDSVNYDEFQYCLLRVLRRTRDRYCDNKVQKNHFVTHNTRRLEEEYLVAESCGKGSFGECMFVTHRVSKKKRVCKTILKAEANVPSEEVEQELNTLRRLDHPNIVRVFEWFESDAAYLLVLEAAEGGDLKKLLAKAQEDGPGDAPRAPGDPKRGIDEDLVSTLMMQALKALIYIHSEMVIHRDIKPANMLLASTDLEKPRLLLADFGVAELFEEHGKMQSIVRGTVAYMAPEVLMNEVSTRSDIWALGIVTFELLCGERPFRGDNPMAMYAQLRTGVIKYEKVLNAGGSESSVGFLKRLLTKEEAQRASAEEALIDPWFTEAAERSITPVLGGRQARRMRRSLSNYMSKGHFAKTAMNCIAAQLDTNRIEGLTAMFQSMDVDNNGKLSPAELAAGLAELGVDPDAIGQLVDTIDVNCDGQIAYSEFVASLLQTQGQLIEDVLFHAFQIFDVNRDGQISKEELSAILSDAGPLSAVLPDGKTVDQVLKEVDTSGDGKISFAEFKAYLQREGQTNTPTASIHGDGEIDGFFDAGEQLTEAFIRLALQLGRSQAELEEQAVRLKEKHWMSTVGDLKELHEEDWARLGLPLKLERALRDRMIV